MMRCCVDENLSLTTGNATHVVFIYGPLSLEDNGDRLQCRVAEFTSAAVLVQVNSKYDELHGVL